MYYTSDMLDLDELIKFVDHDGHPTHRKIITTEDIKARRAAEEKAEREALEREKAEREATERKRSDDEASGNGNLATERTGNVDDYLSASDDGDEKLKDEL